MREWCWLVGVGDWGMVMCGLWRRGIDFEDDGVGRVLIEGGKMQNSPRSLRGYWKIFCCRIIVCTGFYLHVSIYSSY